MEFIGFYGVERFKLDWPALRAALTPPAAKRAGVYDIVWSRLLGGGWNLKPTEDFYRMPARRRQFLVQVALTPGKCIYEVAKSLGMQYRRAHDHAVKLVRDGKLRTMESFEGGHRKLKLFPSSRTKAVQDWSEQGKTTLVELIDEGQIE